MKERGNIIKINDLNEVSIKVGDMLSYAYRKHSSVGIRAYHEIDNTDVIVLDENNIEYLYPERKATAGITGADDARGEFLFKAISAGVSTITFIHEYRGDVEKKHVVKVSVE
jgi:hypothetical protein